MKNKVINFYFNKKNILKMEVKISDKTINLKLSIRTYIYYENITNKAFELKDLSNFVNLITFFYSIILSSAKKEDIDFNMTYEEFIEWIDENGGEFLLVDFVNWFVKEQELQAQILRKDNKKEDTDNKTKKKVKD